MTDIKRISKEESNLVVDLFNKYRMFYGQKTDLTLAEEFINKRLSANESVIFVALDNDGDKPIPVGFTQLYPTYSSVRAIQNWILNDLFVEAAYRKQGTGERLIKAAVQFAHEKRAMYVQLETAVDNYTAQSLYEGIGFKKQVADSRFFVYRIDVGN